MTITPVKDDRYDHHATLIPVCYHYFARHLRQPRVLKIMDRLTDLVFIGFAAKLASSRR
jgi:threonine/homoserine/homoserine lactone efflux protein